MLTRNEMSFFVALYKNIFLGMWGFKEGRQYLTYGLTSIIISIVWIVYGVATWQPITYWLAGIGIGCVLYVATLAVCFRTSWGRRLMDGTIDASQKAGQRLY